MLRLIILLLKGIVEESCFQYQADTETIKCKSRCKNGRKIKINNYCVLSSEEEIKRDILKHGPVIVAMSIYEDFLTYKSGLYIANKNYRKFSNSHAVKIVGWGKYGKKNRSAKYWIIQNSWGDDWGENGFAKILIGQDLHLDKYAYSIDVNYNNSNK